MVGKDFAEEFRVSAKEFKPELEYKAFNDSVESEIEAYIFGEAGVLLVAQVSGTTKKLIGIAIRDGLNTGESIPKIAKRIDALYLEQIIPNRSKAIAATEVIKASNNGSQVAAMNSLLELEKVWLSTKDGRTRGTGKDVHNHIRPDGQAVDKALPFVLVDNLGREEMLMFPADASLGASAGNIIRCRCSQRYRPKGG